MCCFLNKTLILIKFYFTFDSLAVLSVFSSVKFKRSPVSTLSVDNYICNS